MSPADDDSPSDSNGASFDASDAHSDASDASSDVNGITADATDATAEPHSTDELYAVTYHATRNAMWDVVGDVVLTLVLVVVALIGLQMLLASLFTVSAAYIPAVFGLVVLLLAIGGILNIHGIWPFD